MKIIIILLLAVTAGCHNETRIRFHAFADSADVYNQKTRCASKCGKTDSSIYYFKLQKFYVDSMDYYYYKLYPKEKNTAEDIVQNCNCK